MSVINRIILFFYALAFGAVSILTMVLFARFIPDAQIWNEFLYLCSRMETVVVAVVIFICSLYLLIQSLSTHSNDVSTNKADIENLCLRVEVSDYRRYPVTAFVVENFYSGKNGETHTAKLKIDISKIVRGGYYTRYVFYSRKNDVAPFETLEVADGLTFRRRKPDKYQNTWQKAWGSIEMNDIEVLK